MGPVTETEETQDQESVTKDRPRLQMEMHPGKLRNQGYLKPKSKSRARSGSQRAALKVVDKCELGLEQDNGSQLRGRNHEEAKGYLLGSEITLWGCT